MWLYPLRWLLTSARSDVCTSTLTHYFIPIHRQRGQRGLRRGGIFSNGAAHVRIFILRQRNKQCWSMAFLRHSYERFFAEIR